jgi:hypothetical protein
MLFRVTQAKPQTMEEGLLDVSFIDDDDDAPKKPKPGASVAHVVASDLFC